MSMPSDPPTGEDCPDRVSEMCNRPFVIMGNSCGTFSVSFSQFIANRDLQFILNCAPTYVINFRTYKTIFETKRAFFTQFPHRIIQWY